MDAMTAVFISHLVDIYNKSTMLKSLSLKTTINVNKDYVDYVDCPLVQASMMVGKGECHSKELTQFVTLEGRFENGGTGAVTVCPFCGAVL